MRGKPKYFTIMITPWWGGKSYRFRLPLWAFQLAVLVALGLIAGALGAIYQYHQWRDLAQENIYLEEVYRSQEESKEELQQEMEYLEEKLKGIEKMNQELSEAVDLEPPELDLEKEE